MEKFNLFEYMSYRDYIKDRLETLGPKSGLKRRAAESLRVHTTFVSQVVLGKADLSLDQAEGMNQFLEHNEQESEYFIDLVMYARSADHRLRDRFKKRLKDRHSQRAQIKSHLNNPLELSPETQRKFYSSHLYGLIHVLISIPRFRTRNSLISATGFPEKTVNEAVDFLIRVGIVKLKNGQLLPSETSVHLSKNSEHIWRHHANWRNATLQSFEFGEPTDLHYSLAFSCSDADANRIRESLLNHLKSLEKTVSASTEENAYVYCFDFFRWT